MGENKDGQEDGKAAKKEEDKKEPEGNGEGPAKWTWRERGAGVLKLLRHRDTNATRIVMRQKGVLSILLNTPLLGVATKEGQRTVRLLAAEEDATIGSYRAKLANVQEQAELVAELDR